MYSQGETVLVELENGYRWEAEVVEHAVDDSPHHPYDSEHLILDAEKHPADDDVGRMTVQLNDADINAGTMYGPAQNKRRRVAGIWRMESL